MKITKFELFVDLGVITVPNDDNYELLAEAALCFPSYSKLPSRVLRSGIRLHFQGFKQTPEITTSNERMEFLRGSVLLGIQGPPLLLREKQADIPWGFWYSFYDAKNNLLVKSSSRQKVPALSGHRNGEFLYGDTFFDNPCHSWDILVRAQEIIT